MNIAENQISRPQPEKLPLLLTVEQAAHVTGIGRTSAYRLIAAGTWKAVKIGRLTRIPRDWLFAWVSDLVVGDESKEREQGS